jgi:hypothetical protein
MWQSEARKNVNMEAQDSTTLGAVTKQRLAKTAQWEGLIRAVVNWRVSELAIVLQLLVVASFESPVNQITNSNTISSHYVRDNIILLPHFRSPDTRTVF